MSDYATFPTEAQNGGQGFVEHAKNIGRAYQHQAMELIYICQLLSRVSPPRIAREDAELRRTLRVCDIALRSAADSGKGVTDEANTCFEEVTQVLCKYSKRFYPDDPTDFVEVTMGRAKRKDSARKAWSYEQFEDEWRSTTSTNFVLLRSPLANLHDPENIIVRQVLSARPSLSEFLWNFNRYKDRARITLEQSPHFYFGLPQDESAFTPGFIHSPIEDIWVDRQLPDTIYVLIDRPGHVFLENKQENRSFGNVWRLGGFLVFKDTSGVLKGEQLVRSSSSSSTQDNWWHYEQPVISPDSESLARLSHNCLRPIITNPSANPTLGFPLEDWSSLSRPTLHFINIHIYDASRPPRSLEALDLPPLAPTSERPEYRARYTSIDTLCNDILLSICNYYRLDDENNWNIRLGWCKLTHVCRGWRRLVHDSASYLGMHILCINGNPTVDTLDHLSFLPLVVDYQDVSATIGAQDKLGMSHALQLRDRVRRVDLHIPPSNLRELHELHVLDGSFPILEHLSLSPSTEDDRNLILPTTFLAPNLRHLTLLGVDLPKELLLLTSTVSLVTLTLTNTRASGYFLPSHLVTRLQAFPQLEELSIGFSVPISRPSAERELLVTLETPVILPTLKRLTFQGTSAYLESLTSQLMAPLLEQLSITLFNQVAFTLPHLSNFTNAIGRLRLPDAKVTLNRKAVSVVTDQLLPQPDGTMSSLSLRVICKQFDWQIDVVAQICSALMPVLSAVKRLTLDFDQHAIPAEWQDGAVDDTTWHELLRSFVGTRKLRICRALTLELSFALQLDGVGLLLPDLLLLAPELEQEQADNAFSPFIVTRQVERRSVYLSPWLVRSPHPSSENPLQCPVCSVMSDRRQERKRHLLSHLPPWIRCPLPDCQLRGSRLNLFLIHWKTLHSKHPDDTPTRSQFAIYDPDLIYDGVISVGEAEVIARGLVYATAN